MPTEHGHNEANQQEKMRREEQHGGNALPTAQRSPGYTAGIGDAEKPQNDKRRQEQPELVHAVTIRSAICCRKAVVAMWERVAIVAEFLPRCRERGSSPSIPEILSNGSRYFTSVVVQANPAPALGSRYQNWGCPVTDMLLFHCSTPLRSSRRY